MTLTEILEQLNAIVQKPHYADIVVNDPPVMIRLAEDRVVPARLHLGYVTERVDGMARYVQVPALIFEEDTKEGEDEGRST